jgi:titin
MKIELGVRRLWAALFLMTVGPVFSATFTVTNLADAGPGTIRQAITDANATPGADLIDFNIPGTPPFTIGLASLLPPIFETATIDATTQPGYSNKPIVSLNGIAVLSGNGLTLSSGGNVVRGLVIRNFPKYGIEALAAAGGTNTIQGCFIGTDQTGGSGQPNLVGGIHIGASSYNLIGGTNPYEGNLISGNTNDGVWIDGSPNSVGNVIVGNIIGLNAGGTAAIGNSKQGVRVSLAQFTTVGGPSVGARNVISGNGESGVTIEGVTSTNNLIQGNYIGLNAVGTASISNAQWGVRLLSGARYNLVGGPDAGQGNVISGNGKSGLDLNTGAQNNTVQGNLIGTSISGTVAVANRERGITMSGATNNLVGGAIAGARNVISGNLADGIQIFDVAARSNRVEGNYIGVDLTGTNRLGNGGAGIWIINAPANQIGGSTAGAGNVISGNAVHGVYLQSSGATGNQILGNLIGTDATGMVGLGNGAAYYGITIDKAPLNVIGGTLATARNVISSNNTGIWITGTGASNNTILGNYIGTDITGMNGLGNQKDGIVIGQVSFPNEFPRNNTVGGTALGAGNVISGNGFVNAFTGIAAANAPGTTIQGNQIGVKADGVSPLGNRGHNIDVDLATNCVIGGVSPSAWNVIANSGNSTDAQRSGIRLRNGVGNVILGNSIYSNGFLGISLSGSISTANDACDLDSGVNGKQNYPILKSCVSDGFTTHLRGSLDSTLAQAYMLQFYASPAPDGSGYGEGKAYLGAVTVPSAILCSNSFALTLPMGAPAGWVVSATATDPANSTSEFSPSIAIGGAPTLTIQAPAGDSTSISWLATNSFGGAWQLMQATNLTSPVVWFGVTNTPAVTSNGTWFTVPISTTNDTRFFRLWFQ